MLLTFRRTCLALTLSGGLLAATASATCLDIISVSGTSMENTLHPGDRLLIVRTDMLPAAISRRLIRRRSILIANDPTMVGRLVVKRVAGVGGDRLRVADGQLIVNGSIQAEEPTIKRAPQSWPARPGETYDVPSGHYFILADDRITSFDSRVYGAVRLSAAVGVVVGVLTSNDSRKFTPVGATAQRR